MLDRHAFRHPADYGPPPPAQLSWASLRQVGLYQINVKLLTASAVLLHWINGGRGRTG